MTTIRIALLLFLAASFSTPALGRGRGTREKVAWEDVPSVVQATIEAKAEGGTVRSIERRSRRGEVTYKANVKMTDGNLIEIEVNSDGRFISIEVIDPDEADDH